MHKGGGKSFDVPFCHPRSRSQAGSMASPAETSDCSGILPGLRITGMKGAGQGVEHGV